MYSLQGKPRAGYVLGAQNRLSARVYNVVLLHCKLESTACSVTVRD